MILFPEYMCQARYPVHQVHHEDFNPEPKQDENLELLTCDADINAMLQIPDDITLDPLCS